MDYSILLVCTPCEFHFGPLICAKQIKFLKKVKYSSAKADDGTSMHFVIGYWFIGYIVVH